MRARFEGADLGERALGFNVVRAIDEGRDRAVVREAKRDRASDAAGPAGDESDASFHDACCCGT